MARRAPLAPLAAIAVVLALALPVAALDQLVPAESEVQEKIQALYTPIFWVAVVVFVFVEALILFTVLKFGPWGKGKETHEHERGNNKVEIAWTIAPAVILVWVGVISYGTLMEIDASPEDAPVAVTVVGHQWFWEWQYENGLVVKAESPTDTATFFHVPVGEDVLLKVTSADTQHALNIPALGVKLDAYPGIINTFWFNARNEGAYFVQCAEYCGTSHAYMHAHVVAESQGAFDEWLDSELRGQVDARRWPQVARITITDDGVSPANVELLVGAGTRVIVENQGTDEVEFVLGEPFGNRTIVRARGSEVLRITVPEGFTGTDFQVGDFVGEVKANLGRPVSARLFEWGVDVGEGFQPGETVVFNVHNEGEGEHNIYIGTYGDAQEVLANSATIGPDQTASVAFTFPESGDVDFWCNIPGHVVPLGMLTTVTV